ncbi:MAG: pantoate--beta-alanine ligase [Dokdonella sp.]
MQILRNSSAVRAWIGEHRRKGQRIGFVPTMGNLHAGHYSLVSEARRRADVAIASVFVNPTQFGPNEDLARYPRTPDADADGLVAAGCDALFMPGVEEIYPQGIEHAVRIHVPGISDVLEGAIRSHHFDGVASVVARLFNLVQVDLAVFGQKDFQQLLVIQRMVSDLSFPLDVIAAPTVREANGLAMSSRNQYLTSEQRSQAGAIHATLRWMREQILDRGPSDIEFIETAATDRLKSSGFEVDYSVLRRATDLNFVGVDSTEGLVALIAVRLGATRLIDNMLIDRKFGGRTPITDT